MFISERLRAAVFYTGGRVLGLESLWGRAQGQPSPALLTKLIWRAVFDKKYLAEVVLLGCQPLLVQLELAEALCLLVLHGADMLYQVQLDLGGVVAQSTVVIAGLRIYCALVLLQVLKESKWSL